MRKVIDFRMLSNALRHKFPERRCWKNFTNLNFSTSVEAHNLQSILPNFFLAKQWQNKIAITDTDGDYSYGTLYKCSKKLSYHITDFLNGKIQERVALICPNNVSYIISLWACWMSGQVVVPLNSSYPEEMLEYFLEDSGSNLLLTTRDIAHKFQQLSKKSKVELIIFDDYINNSKIKIDEHPMTLKTELNPNIYAKLNALILYTSGTTAMPKGVVINYVNLCAQINAMIIAWKWTGTDTILHVLPLHHIHGIVNALLTPLYCGAWCIMLPKFNAAEVWNQFLTIHDKSYRRVTVFTGVPTMYVRLIEEYEKSFVNNEQMTNFVKASCSQKIRLMMCGSAPLPETVFHKWEQITGHRLLERYGMSETGMVLSNPLDGLRKPGFVGNPLPGTFVRITSNNEILLEGNEFGTKIMFNRLTSENKLIGELQVKGDNVFQKYWNKQEITKQEFTEDGWFKTGDTAEFFDESYRILGRSSVDIIKSGGYKVSALFVETILLQNCNIKDVAVIGLPDPTWGQKVVALVVPHEKAHLTSLFIKKWAKDKLPAYMIPSVKIVDQIPRNTMGKVNKKSIIREMFGNQIQL